MIKDSETGALKNFNFNELLEYIPGDGVFGDDDNPSTTYTPRKTRNSNGF